VSVLVPLPGTGAARGEGAVGARLPVTRGGAAHSAELERVTWGIHAGGGARRRFDWM